VVGNAELVSTKWFVSGKKGLFDIACNVDAVVLLEQPTLLQNRSDGRLFHASVTVTEVSETMIGLMYLIFNC
jgi:hypothetical protein